MENIILDWPKLWAVLFIVLSVVAVLLFTPKRVLRKVAMSLGLSPNMVTVIRIPLHYVGMGLARLGLLHWASLLLSLSWMLDNTDGKLSRANGGTIKTDFDDDPSWQTFKSEFGHHGKTSIGAWMDPLADKLQSLPTLGRLAFWEKALDWRLYLVMLVADVIGTGMRPPFLNDGALERAELTWLKKVAATWLGKTKATFQFLTIGAWVFQYLGILNPEVGLPGFFLAFATIFAWLSVFSKLNWGYMWRRLLQTV